MCIFGLLGPFGPLNGQPRRWHLQFKTIARNTHSYIYSLAAHSLTQTTFFSLFSQLSVVKLRVQ